MVDTKDSEKPRTARGVYIPRHYATAESVAERARIDYARAAVLLAQRVAARQDEPALTLIELLFGRAAA